MNNIILNIAKISFSFDQIELNELLFSSEESDAKLKREAKDLIVRKLRRHMKKDIFVYHSGRLFVFQNRLTYILDEINKRRIGQGSQYSLITKTGASKIFNLNEIKDLEPEDLSLIRVLIGEIIATKLRLGNYIISSIKSHASNIDAFRASFSDEIETVGPVEIYPGFEYRIFNISNDLYIALDPRKSVLCFDTLRFLWDNDPKIRKKLLIGEEQFFIDTCGVELDECEHRKSPYSLCELGSNRKKRIRIEKFDTTISPRSEQLDLIEYLRQYDRCISKSLPNKIIPEPPVAIRLADEDELYYPLERLRREVDLSRLAKEEKKGFAREITTRFQPNVDERLEQSKTSLNVIKACYIPSNDSMTINRLGLSSFINYDSENRDLHCFEIEQRIIFKNGEPARTAIFGLDRFGPYERKNCINPQRIQLLCFGFNDSQFRYFSNAIQNWNPIRRKTKPYPELFEVKFEIKEVAKDKLLSYKQEDKSLIRIAVLAINERSSARQIEELRNQLFSLGTPSQRIGQDVLNKLKAPQLTNIILGICGKAGIQSWVASTPRGKKNGYNSKKLFVGIANSFPSEKKAAILKMSLFHSNGEFIKIIWEKVPQFEYRSRLGEILNGISEEYEGYAITIHRNGAILELGEAKLFKELFETQVIHSVIEILHQSPIFRLYREKLIENEDIIESVEKGVYLQLDQNKYILRTSDETPEEIQTETTIQINFRHGDRKNYISEIEDIFRLTMAYVGATRYSTKLPVTLHNLSNLSNDPPARIDLLPKHSNILL